MTELGYIICPSLSKLTKKVEKAIRDMKRLEHKIEDISMRDTHFIRREIEPTVRSIIDEVLDEKRRMGE